MSNFSSATNISTTPKRPREEEETVDEQPSEHPLPTDSLLLSTTYALNRSSSKKVTVGLEVAAGRDPAVVVKFTTHYANGISLNRQEWEELCERLSIILPWFDADEKEAKSSILLEPLGRQKITFTTAYSKKAIVLQLVQEARNEDPRLANQNAKKTYTPCLVMQKTTCVGLFALIPCINERIRLLTNQSAFAGQTIEHMIEDIGSEAVVKQWIMTPALARTAGFRAIAKQDLNLSLADPQPTPASYSVEQEVQARRRMICYELLTIQLQFFYHNVLQRIEELKP